MSKFYKQLSFLLCLMCFVPLNAADQHLIIEPSDFSFGSLSKNSLIYQLGEIPVLIDPENNTISYKKNNSWQAQDFTELPKFAAYAEGVDKIYIVGGIIAGQQSKKVFDLSLVGDKLQLNSLPDMPHGVLNAGASVFKGALYVCGGLESVYANEATKKAIRYNFSSDTKAWEKLDDLPEAVYSPSVIEGFEELLLIGGKVFDQAGVVVSTNNVMGFRLAPIDGQIKKGWRELAPIPQTLSNNCVAKLGQSHILLLGGESIKSNEKSELSKQVYFYHNMSNTWMTESVDMEARTNAFLIKQGDDYLLCGGRNSEGKIQEKVLGIQVQRVVKSLGAIDYAVIVVYFIIMAGIGVFFAKKQDTAEEYALGNRGVKWWAAGISMFATAASSISFMAIPALVAATSLVHVSGVLLIIPAFFVSAYLTYPLLRRLKITSTFEYMELRFGKSLRIVGSIQNITYQLAGRMSVVMLLPALAISAVTGLDIMISILLMGGLTTLYTCFGGFEAVIWSDVMQGGMMLLGLLIIAVFGIWALPEGFTTFYEVNQANHKLNAFLFSSDMSLPLFIFFALNTIIVQMNFVSDQSLAQRILCTPEKDVPKLAGAMTACSIVVALLAGFAGLSLFAYFATFPDKMDVMMKNDSMIPLFIVQQLPVGLVGLIIAALFAASMSTLSSSMNSCAVLISEDFYKRFSKNPDEQKALKIMKVSTFALGAIGTSSALILSRIDTPALMQVWAEICAVLSGGFIGVAILGVFTRRTNCGGAVVGVAASIIVSLLLKNYSTIHWSSFAVFSTLSCLFFGYFSSFILPGKKRDLRGLTLWDMYPSEEDDQKSANLEPKALES